MLLEINKHVKLTKNNVHTKQIYQLLMCQNLFSRKIWRKDFRDKAIKK